MLNKIFEKFKGMGFWGIFAIVLVALALTGMVISFFLGLLASFFRFVYYLSIPAFIIAVIIWYKFKKKGGRLEINVK